MDVGGKKFFFYIVVNELVEDVLEVFVLGKRKKVLVVGKYVNEVIEEFYIGEGI